MVLGSRNAGLRPGREQSDSRKAGGQIGTIHSEEGRQQLVEDYSR